MGEGEAMRVVCLVGALALSACASIHAVESTTDTSLPPLVGHMVQGDSIDYEVVSSTVSGYELVVVIRQSETCATLTTQRTHRHRHIDRQADSTATRATWGLALASIVTGVYGYADAGRVAARSTDGTTPADVREYSGGVLALGGLAIVVGIIDAVRASDSEFDDGVVESRPTRETFVCHRHDSRDMDVKLELPNEHFLRGHTDEQGAVTFSFLDVSEEGVPDPAAQVVLSIDGTTTSLANFGTTQRRAVRESLLAEPRSQLAVQVLQRRRDACDGAIAAARASAPADRDDVAQNARAPWLSAKSTCADLWTSVFAAELQALEERIVDGDCRHRLDAAAQAFVEDSGVTVGELSDELALLHTRCTTLESTTKLRQLDGKLAMSVKRLERESAAETRRAARAQERAAAQLRAARERARSERSSAEAAPSWPTESRRSCCKVCSAGKACGDSCIAAWKTCHKGAGCACDE